MSQDNTPSDPAPPLRLNNVYASSSRLEKVSATISSEAFDYFFRHLLAGRRGPHQAIISTFFQKLHHECTIVRSIPGVYDPDAESLLASVLADLNFRREPISGDKGTPPRRRAPAGTSERKGKSAPRKRDTGAA